jgi:hypothetical protein
MEVEAYKGLNFFLLKVVKFFGVVVFGWFLVF